MADECKRSYGWYKHHAWGALALLSIFFAVTRFYPQIPSYLTIVVVTSLCLYALVAIFLTYRHNKENVQGEGDAIIVKEKMDYGSELEKERLKAEKKRLKAEAKRIKKEHSK